MKVLYYFKRIKNIFKEGLTYTRLCCFPAGHYYSPIVDLEDYRKNKTTNDSLNDIKLEESNQLELLNNFKPFLNIVSNWNSTPKDRYQLKNDWFPSTDGKVLHCILQYFEPSRIIEIGSGYSSALMLDVNEKHLKKDISFTFIEPNPNRLELLLTENDWKNTEIITQQVQKIELEKFKTPG